MISSMPPRVILAGAGKQWRIQVQPFSSHRASLASSACLEALLSAHAPLGAIERLGQCKEIIGGVKVDPWNDQLRVC